MYKSEIRDSQIEKLYEKVNKLNYEKYLYKINIIKCRAFENQEIVFAFPVTALIGPNGGGKTTILGASALLYNSVAPRQFFTRNKQLDEEMRDWAIVYDAIDRKINKTGSIKRTASFLRERWYRHALDRETLFFGVSRTLPAVERRELSKYTNKNVVFKEDERHLLGIDEANQISKVLGKDVSSFAVIKPNQQGNVMLLSGSTDERKTYSEFHFGAGESSIIKMIMNIEKSAPQSLVLIEEIENGLHPKATEKLVEYLIDVAYRKNMQIIFTTHSEYAIAPLPPQAIWTALNGKAFQGKLDIQSLRSLTGETDAKLAIFVEDEFAKNWVETILRTDESVALDAVEIYVMGGDGTATKVHFYHKKDPSTSLDSICIIDGDSKQKTEEGVFRLPGKAPERYIYDAILNNLDECIAKLAVRCMRKDTDAEAIKEIIQEINQTNRDHHLLFEQVGEKVGRVESRTIEDAFLATWTEEYEEEVNKIIKEIKPFLPTLTDEK